MPQTVPGHTPVNIEDEMKSSYLDYAMSVIVGRAIPDVRDGLKPVHRRILYAMYELGLSPNKPYKKAARVVGEVLGKYHPHGDTAVYDAIVRMVQDFSLRYPLIQGQGNFGSVDGDSAAAMRYTEVRRAKISDDVLKDINKDTVDFGPNFDDSLTEPLVLPACLPNLLINGSSGIAVGMATNMAPHNIGEVIDGIIALIDHPEAQLEDLLPHITGPDFPTGGFIYGKQGIMDAYATGRGMIKLRAKVAIEQNKDRDTIIVSELPYQVNKARLLEKMGELIRHKKIEGIADLRDESDREGMRIVVELKRGEIAQIILNQLLKHTAMETTFGIINLAIVSGQPRVLTLKELLALYLRHRQDVIVRRTRFELKQAEDRLHILEGQKIALENLDAVISLIRGSRSPEEARKGLRDKFTLSIIQAQAILETRLQRLTALEREKIVAEYQELQKSILQLKEILESRALVFKIIKEELIELKDKYADPRRTVIMEKLPELGDEDLIADEDVVVMATHQGYIKRSPLGQYRIQHRSGVGIKGITTKEADFVKHLFIASTHAYLLFFTDTGRLFWLKVHEVPTAGRYARGVNLVNLIRLNSEERITAMLTLREFNPEQFVVLATKRGKIKRVSQEAFSRPRLGGIIAISLKEGDKLIGVSVTDGAQDILLCTRLGKALRFNENNLRSIGRQAQGVRGIKLREHDEVVGMEVISEGGTILTVTELGYGKRTKASGYPVQGRACQGVINLKITRKNGPVVGVTQVSKKESVMLITATGTLIWVMVKGIPGMGRATTGVRLQNLDSGDKLVAVAKLAEDD